MLSSREPNARSLSDKRDEQNNNNNNNKKTGQNHDIYKNPQNECLSKYLLTGLLAIMCMEYRSLCPYAFIRVWASYFSIFFCFVDFILYLYLRYKTFLSFLICVVCQRFFVLFFSAYHVRNSSLSRGLNFSVQLWAATKWESHNRVIWTLLLLLRCWFVGFSKPFQWVHSFHLCHSIFVFALLLLLLSLFSFQLDVAYQPYVQNIRDCKSLFLGNFTLKCFFSCPEIWEFPKDAEILQLYCGKTGWIYIHHEYFKLFFKKQDSDCWKEEEKIQKKTRFVQRAIILFYVVSCACLMCYSTSSLIYFAAISSLYNHSTTMFSSADFALFFHFGFGCEMTMLVFVLRSCCRRVLLLLFLFFSYFPESFPLPDDCMKW